MIYGYIRVSTDRQTVENQRFEINRFCDAQKIVVERWLEETISGTKKLEVGIYCAHFLERNREPIQPTCVAFRVYAAADFFFNHHIAISSIIGSSFHSLPNKTLPFSFLLLFTPSSPHVPHCLKKNATSCSTHCF